MRRISYKSNWSFCFFFFFFNFVFLFLFYFLAKFYRCCNSFKVEKDLGFISQKGCVEFIYIHCIICLFEIEFKKIVFNNKLVIRHSISRRYIKVKTVQLIFVDHIYSVWTSSFPVLEKYISSLKVNCEDRANCLFLL